MTQTTTDREVPRMTVRLVKPEEGCPHTHTSGATTWSCARKRHSGSDHHMVVVR